MNEVKRRFEEWHAKMNHIGSIDKIDDVWKLYEFLDSFEGYRLVPDGTSAYGQFANSLKMDRLEQLEKRVAALEALEKERWEQGIGKLVTEMKPFRGKTEI